MGEGEVAPGFSPADLLRPQVILLDWSSEPYQQEGSTAQTVQFRRKNIRLPRHCYVGQQWYFLTACTLGRAARFRNAGLVEEHLPLLGERARAEEFAIQAYCFMPEHLHLLVSGNDATSDCLAFVNGFKQRSGFTFKQRTGQQLWQQKSYDHILRPGERWQAVAYYIWMNPVRSGLCKQPQEWPFSGSQTVDWRRLMSSAVEEVWIPPWKK